MTNAPQALVVSADPNVRRLIAVTLHELGCGAVDAASGWEALARAGDTSVDFVIVDVSRSTALDANMVRQLRADQPDLRVLYLVGRARAGVDLGFPGQAFDAFLRKPFGLDELSDLVASWLHEEVAPLRMAGPTMH